MTSERTSTPTTLLVSDRGALSFLGLFFCILLIAMTFYVLGIGRTVLAQEGMQDAADAATYASAIVHARGMNLIVHINWVMAALVAILIALRLVQSLFVIAGLLATALAFVTFGASLAIVPVCAQNALQFEQIYERTKPVVFAALKGLHYAEKAIAYIVPAAATIDALVESGKTHAPADAVFALPGRISLPVESDKFSVLCEHGAETMADLALTPVTPVVGEKISGALSGAVGEMGKALSGFLCGDGEGSGAKGGTPPSQPTTVERHYPGPPPPQPCATKEECDQAVEKGKAAQVEYEKNEAIAKPDSTGRCSEAIGQDGTCNEDHPYEVAARQARAVCKERPDFSPFEYVYVQQKVRSTMRVTTAGVVEELRQVKSSVLTTGLLPCGQHADLRSVWSDYNELAKAPGSPYARPVCDLASLRVGGAPGTRPVAVDREIVAHVFSCTVRETFHTPLAKPGETLVADGGKDKSPMKVNDDLELGGEDFQIRAFAYGENVGPGQYLKGVKLATWKQKPKEEAVVQEATEVASDVMALMHHFSVAQGEYYFSSVEKVTRAEWMWQAGWTARLRRFRLPEEGDAAAPDASPSSAEESAQFGGMEASQTKSDSCSASGAQSCEELDSILEELQETILH